MKGMDRYFSFGIRKNWIDIFFRYQGSAEFWNTDGDNFVANKKKDAFLNFLKDAGLVIYNKSNGGDKYTKYEPSEFAHKLFQLGSDSESMWGILLCNLAYTSELSWFIKNIKPHETYTLDKIKYMLEDVMEGDTKGLGKRNVADAFKMLLIKTPLGSEIGLGHCDYKEKVSANGTETITLTSFYRGSWENPDPKVILYSLYKFEEACGNYYQFSLTRLLNHDIDSDGISPTEIFGLDRTKMEKILNGLTFNYPEFIDASFSLGLDNITLRTDKKSEDILELF